MEDDNNTVIPNLHGLWIECCEPTCKKWRYVANIDDPLEVPEKWYCSMNSDKSRNKCSAPECTELPKDEMFIESKFKAGSIVWAKVIGHPWSPAMIDFSPEFKRFYWFDNPNSIVPSQYYVTFFGKTIVTRAWIKSNFFKPFVGNENPSFALKAKLRGKNLTVSQRKKIVEGCAIAEEAMHLTILQRLKKYSYNSWRLAKQLSKLFKNTENSTNSIQPAPHADSGSSENDAGPSGIEKNTLIVINDRPRRSLKQPKKKEQEKYSTKTSFKREKTPVVTTAENENTELNDSGINNATEMSSSSNCDSLNDTCSVNSSLLQDSLTFKGEGTFLAPLNRHAIDTRKEQKNQGVAEKYSVLSDKKHLNVSEIRKAVNKPFQKLVVNSNVAQTKNEEPSSIDKVIEEGEATMVKSPEVIECSPQRPPSSLSLRLRSLNEDRKNRCSLQGSMSEKLIRNDKENELPGSRYLKALSEFTTRDESAHESWTQSGRKTGDQTSAIRKPPAWFFDDKKREEEQEKSFEKVISRMSIDGDIDRIRTEARQSLLSETSGESGPTVSRQNERLEKRPQHIQYIELLTSDEDF
ncbi:MORC family CW-type zinc finger protein 4-like [Neodiprion lecontei]|uniref:MORC family CW-type zinc finger protein 4-like n=1 Tax=Neodiprion lecontei TaxID=441921 RepID=A0ABM3FXK5_NEOLC|nr:MORC family CW-type zinc finger protein 4-like [Neodiprion lecontei]